MADMTDTGVVMLAVQSSCCHLNVYAIEGDQYNLANIEAIVRTKVIIRPNVHVVLTS